MEVREGHVSREKERREKLADGLPVSLGTCRAAEQVLSSVQAGNPESERHQGCDSSKGKEVRKRGKEKSQGKEGRKRGKENRSGMVQLRKRVS